MSLEPQAVTYLVSSLTFYVLSSMVASSCIQLFVNLCPALEEHLSLGALQTQGLHSSSAIIRVSSQNLTRLEQKLDVWILSMHQISLCCLPVR